VTCATAGAEKRSDAKRSDARMRDVKRDIEMEWIDQDLLYDYLTSGIVNT
jgi:hypothetical protein